MTNNLSDDALNTLLQFVNIRATKDLLFSRSDMPERFKNSFPNSIVPGFERIGSLPQCLQLPSNISKNKLGVIHEQVRSLLFVDVKDLTKISYKNEYGTFYKHKKIFLFDPESISGLNEYFKKEVGDYDFYRDLIFSNYETCKRCIDAFKKANEVSYDWYTCDDGSTFMYNLAFYFALSGEFEKMELFIWGFYEVCYEGPLFTYADALKILIFVADCYPKRFIKTVIGIMTSDHCETEEFYECFYSKITNKRILKTLLFWETKLNWKFIERDKFIVPSLVHLRKTFFKSWYKNISMDKFDQKYLDIANESNDPLEYFVYSFYFSEDDENPEKEFKDMFKSEILDPVSNWIP